MKCGDPVRLRTPGNVRMDGTTAYIHRLETWGAHVLAPAAAGGNYRAAWEEMEPLTADVLVTVNGRAPKMDGKPAPHAGPTQVMGFTGNACDRCGSVRMVRAGTCERCLDCGDTSGGCS
jgi:hypothetical protein